MFEKIVDLIESLEVLDSNITPSSSVSFAYLTSPIKNQLKSRPFAEFGSDLDIAFVAAHDLL